MRSPLALLILLGTVAACASAPRNDAPRAPTVDGAAVARSVVLCRTPLTELEARLGAPSRDGLLGQTRVLTWITDWEPLVRYLGVAVDARGTVVDLYWNLPTEMPWSPTNRCPQAAGPG